MTNSIQSDKKDRRDFLGLALAGGAAVGGGFALFGVKRTWDVLPSVVSAGFTTIDLTQMTAGKLYTTTWRGKPIFVLKKTKDMPSSDIKRDCCRRRTIQRDDRAMYPFGVYPYLRNRETSF